MAVSLSELVRNAMIDAWEATIGTSPVLRFYTGARPSSAGVALTGTLLCQISLPSDWMANAASAVKVKSGTWSNNAQASGIIGYYAILASGGAVHEIGTVSAPGGGGDMIVDNVNVVTGQQVLVNTFQKTASNF